MELPGREKNSGDRSQHQDFIRDTEESDIQNEGEGGKSHMAELRLIQTG